MTDHKKATHSESSESQTTPVSPPFQPPRHWIAPEELDPAYWAQPEVLEKRGQEFYEKPVEWLEHMDQSSAAGLARRDFLTVMGASMAMASFACARRPVHKIIPYVVKPEEITPGIPNFYASTCQECSSGCGVLVKTREGRPIKLEGNGEHPANQGSLCGRGQASLLNLYDPDRLKSPVQVFRGQQASREVSWKEVDDAITGRLKSLSVSGGAHRIRMLTGPISGESSLRLIQEFLNLFSDARHIEFDPLGLEELSESQAVSYGARVVPHYILEKAEVILSLGADFLSQWISPVEHSRAWAKNRKLQGQKPSAAELSKLIVFESILTVTGSNADERYVIRPGDELKVALAIAHVLILEEKKSSFAGHSTVVAALAAYTPEKVASQLGLEQGAKQFRQIAHLLSSHSGKGLVIAGGLSSQTGDALALQVAVNFLNSVLANEGHTVDGSLRAVAGRGSLSAVLKLIEEMQTGQIQALVIARTNPLYTLSQKSLHWKEALGKVPLVVVVSDRVDETGILADYVLPDHHFLENWGDAHPQGGLYSLQQPVIAPIHSTRAFEETLLAWGKTLSNSRKSLLARASDWHQYLRSHWEEVLYPAAGAVGSFEQFWEGTLRLGVLDLFAATHRLSEKPRVRSFDVASFRVFPSGGARRMTSSLSLALYAKTSMHDGRSANNAWLQEMPDPISSVAWDNYVNVSPALAKKLQLKNDDVVALVSADVRVELPVFIQPGLHPEVVSVAVGYGRTHAGKVGNLAGVNVYPFVEISAGRSIFSGQAVQLEKTGRIYQLASTQWHTATENRPIINDVSLAEYRKNPAVAQHTDPHLRLDPVPSLWPAHSYPSYRWGMAIDLNSCTGCGACVIACQAENNIPVVGRDQVRVSRQMHWIKIDRYYSGDPNQPQVVFQPMLCQHCENAPCETVCPVLATVHDDEGLNVQVYNRCVGTRYCQNNCPYKVRRFNFFDHWKSYTSPMNLVWNPDVTVRSRGVMEKCTFCNQRIREAKDHAKDASERVQDGDLKTACQQTCPTDAIVFGDMNDPKSRVSQMKNSPHAFRVLEVLNTKPSVSYMTKVRNQEAAAHSTHPKGGE